MSDYFKDLKFKFPWRDYQARVLEDLSTHLDDDKLHVVAAPGSGKTILGLEVMRQLNKASLILAPSIAIRNQWIERLTDMFMPHGAEYPEWISTDIRQPKYLTVITYQALHAVMSGKEAVEEQDGYEEEEKVDKDAKEDIESFDVITSLNDLNVQTLVLDEAHHLRKEWWKALDTLTAELNKAKIVSLTATPPYDVNYAEWQRYEGLCGAVDAEISVPELVKCGNLCPHQDYIHFSKPTEFEAQKIKTFNNGLYRFLEDLKRDDAFLSLIASHPWVSHTEECVEDILSDAELFSAIVIFINACGHRPPKFALKLLGVGEKAVPPIDGRWLEILLTNFLYRQADDFPEFEDKIKSLRRELKRIGAIERRRIVLDHTKDLEKLLAGSIGKLESIVEIARQESASLGARLRMVVLTDYIRKENLPNNANESKAVNKLGVVPIFEYIRQAQLSGIKIGVLTGSLIFIPKSSQELLEKIARENDFDVSHIKYKPLVHDDSYWSLDIVGESRKKIVHLITELFSAGGINILTGTAALLGEGWDAPSVNTLVLASYVGSYMLSNQMRGRAIRIDPDHPDKVANIWHLATVDRSKKHQTYIDIFQQNPPESALDVFNDIKADLGHDFNKLRRRFRVFEGLSHAEPYIIENGFRRLDLSKVVWNAAGIKAFNDNMFHKARHREAVANGWTQALIGKSPKPEIHELIQTPSNSIPKIFGYANTLKYLVMNAIFGGFVYFLDVLQHAQRSSDLKLLIVIGLIAWAIYAVPKLCKALYLNVRNGSIEGSLKQIGWTIIDTLSHMDLIKTHPQQIRVQAEQTKHGYAYCKVEGLTKHERMHFMQAMEDILSPIDNQRYIIIRRSKWLNRLMRTDYHAVPKVIAQNKKNAEYFLKKWQRYVGDGTLIYTRNIDGRMLLLKARTESFSSAFQKKAERVSVWE